MRQAGYRTPCSRDDYERRVPSASSATWACCGPLSPLHGSDSCRASRWEDTALAPAPGGGRAGTRSSARTNTAKRSNVSS